MAQNLFLHTQIDRSDGSGSRSAEEDWIDQNTTAKQNVFSTSQTTFRPDDAPKHLQQKYERLKDWNDNKWSSERRGENKQAMIREDARTFCNILDVTDSEEEQVLHLIEESDMSSNNFGGKPYEKVLIAIISLVSDKYTEHIGNRVIYHEKFDDLLEHVAMDRGEHTRLRQNVRERTEFKTSDS